jgi:glycosyltransferase involved in cell wall biosynthesis
LVAIGDVVSLQPHSSRSLTTISIYLEPAPAESLARALIDGMDRASAIDHLVRDERWRVVRFAPLDVCTDSRLRLVQVITSLQFGGAERIALALDGSLRRQGVACRLVTLGRSIRQSFPSPPEMIDLSLLTHDPITRAVAARRASRDFNADVIHAHLLDAGQLMELGQEGIPVVVTVHNQRAGWPSGLESLGPSGAALLAACARTVEADLAREGVPVPVRTVWNGIDAGAFQATPARRKAGLEFRRRLGIGRNELVLLSVANPRQQKRLDLLPAVLQATRAELARRAVDREARLVIVGEASPFSQDGIRSVETTRAEAARLGLNSQIRWAGPMQDVASALAAADVLVSTSDHEGLSLAMLEALAAGVPVVATDVGAVAEIAPGDPAVTILPRTSGPDDFGSVLADRACRPIAASLPPHLTTAAMAGRYTWLYSRVIASSARQRSGDGLFLVTNNLSIGGAQSSARRLLLGLSEKGVKARAAVLQEQPDNPTPGRRALVNVGVPVTALPPAGATSAADAVALLLEEIDSDPPDAVLLWNVMPSYRVLIADALLSLPLFDVSAGALSFDSLEDYFSRPRGALPYRTTAEYGARLAGSIVKYSAEADRAARALVIPVHIIPNGVSIDRSLRRSAETRFVIGTAARLNPQKRLDHLLEAMRLVHNDLPPYRLRIAGGIESGCEDHVLVLRQLGEGLPIEWLGSVDDSAEFLRDLDLFVLIAEPAGCPNASLEAMACGLPVIATNCGGMSEQVIDGVTGRLVGRDDIDGLAAAILEAARNPSARSAWGEAGRRRIEDFFSLDRMIDSYIRVCNLRPTNPGNHRSSSALQR